MNLRYTITIVLFLSVIPIGFTQCLSDNFNTSYGNWEDSGTYRNSTSGNEGEGVGFNATNDFIVTNTVLTNPESIQFQLSRSSSAEERTLSIQYAESLAGSWTEAGSISVDQTTESHQLKSIPLNLIGEFHIRILMSYRNGGSYYLDDVSIICSGSNASELQILDEIGNLQNCGYLLDFGAISTNQTFQKTLTIKNTGDVNLEISNITTTASFTISEPLIPVTILPNEEISLTIIFNPNSTGEISGELHIINSDANESDCLISLTGSGFLPAPEIDIERNTEATIPSGSESNIGYNTLFASTVVGETSNTKTYFIHNEGELDLNIYDVNVSNPSEFNISSNPSNTSIPSHTKVEFQITFTPSTSGIRTAIITIENNDNNENPYTFEVQGTGTCSTTTLLAHPQNGPPGTTVTVTASNFGTETTANLNGISAIVKPISETKIEVIVPEHATSGNLTIINNLGCSNTTNFNITTTKTTNCEGNNSNTSNDLFISEITDHPSGSHSYIEIFNGTGSSVELKDYNIEIHYNGTTIRALQLDDLTLNNQDVFVIAFGANDAENPNSSHGFDQLSNLVGINNNDNVRLFHNGTWIDLWGHISGEPFTETAKGYTYRRKNNLTNSPSIIWNSDEWNIFNTVDYTDIGTFDFSNGIAPIITTQPVDNTLGCSLSAELSITAEEGFIGQKQLQYQWFFNLPESDTWDEVVNDENHEGAQTPTLKILNTVQINGFQYYCRILEDSELCYTATNSVKISVDESIWTGTEWIADKTPTENSFSIINNNYNTLIHGNITTCGLYIPIEKTLTIGSDTHVEVKKELHIEGELLLKNKSSFIQGDNSEIINTGVITIEKETAILNAWYEYTYWSSPVKNDIFSSVFKNSKRLYWYKASNFVDIYMEENNNNAQELGQDDVDDNANDWQAIGENQTINGSDNLQAGVGYAATHTNTDFTEGNTYLYTFTGDFNNGTIYTPVERNDESNLDSNWNLIGNPYPSAIDVKSFFDANVNVLNSEGTLEGVIYLWSHDTPPSETYNGNELLNFSPSDYAIINGSGSIAAQIGEGTKPDNFIPSCQGFFVKFSDNYIAPNGHVIFNNTMRVANKNTQFFKQQESNKIWINLTSDNGVFSQTLVSYISGAKDDFDGSYFDVETHISKDTSAKLYSMIHESDKKLTIQGKDLNSIHEDEKITLGFYSSIDIPTIYTLSLDDFRGAFLQENELYLEDTFLNLDHNLKDSDYTFTSEPGEHNNRFYLKFKSRSLTVEGHENTTNLSIIQLNTDEWLFKLNSNKFKMKTISIYNYLGQHLYKFNTTSNREIYNLKTLKSGTYIASVSSTNNNFRKKFIKK
ncbi:choice-of-anchor D domain-containing protein [Formosa sp. PL04]|uniref:choice-of-anchor D domain-containing protein n=1 Tax=Formosa sp. PL04 TaxID=3081755 RepID=UPI002982607C|nr:choice-of-anchor D domain-containing protein [Formosa sp. PL04]MDW5289120.1 choice-of-anchor D domain-containing protein [Formosa sp. PL04]